MQDFMQFLNNNGLTLLVVGIIVFSIYWYLSSCRYRVPPTDKLLVFRRNGTFKEVRGPGFVFVWKPFEQPDRYETTDYVPPGKAINDVKTMNVQINPKPLEPRGCYTKDGGQVDVSTTVYFQLADPVSARLNVSNYNVAIKESVKSALRSTVGTLTVDDIIAKRQSIKREVFDAVSKESENYGVRIQNIEITDITLDQDVYESIRNRITSTRDAEAMAKRAEGELERARLQSEAIVAKASAEKKAKAYKAKGLREIGDMVEDYENNIKNVIQLQWIESLADLKESPNSKMILLPYSLGLEDLEDLQRSNELMEQM